MHSTTDILAAYYGKYPKRARGGLFALSGFNLQIRTYLARLVEGLLTNAPEQAGQVFLEGLSDILQRGDIKQVCIQVKRTLSWASLGEAAEEFLAIDEFLQEYDPALRPEVTFELVAQQSQVIGLDRVWERVRLRSSLPDRGQAELRLRDMLKNGRILPPRIQPDPWWSMVAAVFPILDDPFSFAREALDICLRRGLDSSGAEWVRDEIARLFAQHRRENRLAGDFVSREKVCLNLKSSKKIVLGDIVTLDHLRDGRFMERPGHIMDAVRQLEELITLRNERDDPQFYTFWIDGRSGCGKSVLLLQLMRELILNRQSKVIWLDDASEELFPLLEAWAHAPRPDPSDWFVFVDDFNAPQKRDALDYLAFGRLLRQFPFTEWPIIVTCGPPEQHSEMVANPDAACFYVQPWRLSPVDDLERARLKTWYLQRTGQQPKTGGAFTQDEGLFISMMFEMASGDLRIFGARFYRRLQGESLVEPLILPLALNRLYIWAPTNWLTEEQYDALRRLNSDHDFSVLSLDSSRKYVRLTHPHLSDFIYRAMRSRADGLVFARDLANAFRKALHSDWQVALRILLRVVEGHDRLSIVDSSELAKQMSQAWIDCLPALRLPKEEEARLWILWAKWCARQPEVKRYLYPWGPVEKAADLLEFDNPRWGALWFGLMQVGPDESRLLDLALRWLPSSLSGDQWSRVWETALEIAVRRGRSREAEELMQFGLAYLHHHINDPLCTVWSYVWQGLMENQHILRRAGIDDLGIVSLGLNWLRRYPDRREWSHIWEQALASLPDSSGAENHRKDLLRIGFQWLVGHEDTGGWSHVWEALVKSRSRLFDAGVGITHLLEMGVKWLAGREEAGGWVHVWRVILVTKLADSPPCLKKPSVLKLGYDWLKGREDRADWSFVWEAMVEAHSMLSAAGIDRDELLTLGARWLNGREARPEFAYILESLLKVKAKDQSGDLNQTSLRQRGLQWLQERFDSDMWSHLWEALIIPARRTPGDPAYRTLLELGYSWCHTPKTRRNWNHVAAAVLENADHRFGPLPDMIHTAFVRLSRNTHEVGWDRLWMTLTYHIDSVYRANHRPQELIEMAIDWLVDHVEDQAWLAVWDRAVVVRDESGYVDVASRLPSIAKAWLERYSYHQRWADVWFAALRGCPVGDPTSSMRLHEVAFSWLLSTNGQLNDGWPSVWLALSDRVNGNCTFGERLRAAASTWMDREANRTHPKWVPVSLRV